LDLKQGQHGLRGFAPAGDQCFRLQSPGCVAGEFLVRSPQERRCSQSEDKDRHGHKDGCKQKTEAGKHGKENPAWAAAAEGFELLGTR
jgi:hypothetical protein